MRARHWIAALAVVSGIASPAVRAANAVAATNPAKIFTFRLLGEPETLDWNRAHTPIETYLLLNLMEGLLTLEEGAGSTMKIAPALAESYSRSADGLTYTFRLRKGVKWSDGVPLRATDFVYSWRRLLSPLTAASYAYLLFDVVGAEDFYKGKEKDFSKVGIRAPDDSTFVVTLTKPLAHWIYIPTFWVTFPMREDVVTKNGVSWTKPGNMVTLGPFTLAAHDVESKIVMKANPTYYGGRIDVEEAVGLIVRDDSTALTLYESGKFDFTTDLSTLDLKRLSGRADLKSFPYLKTGYLGFTVGKYPTSNTRLRRAVAMAIDKSGIPQILHGGQTPATAFIPPGVAGYSSRAGLPFDPVRAKQELRASGVDSAKPISIELLAPNWDKPLTLAQFIQGELKKNLGIEAVIQPFDHKTYRAQLDLHAFPIFEASWSADYPDPDNFMSLFLGDSGNNRTQWKSAAYDALVLSARSEMNAAKRLKAYAGAQKLLIEDEAAIVPLYYEPNWALVRPRVQGLVLNPMNYLYLKKVHLGG